MSHSDVGRSRVKVTALLGSPFCVRVRPRAPADGKLTSPSSRKDLIRLRQSIHAGAEKAAKELGVTVIWRDRCAKTIALAGVRGLGFVTRGVAGLCSRRSTLRRSPPVADASARHPCRRHRSDEGERLRSFVATDNRKAAALRGTSRRPAQGHREIVATALCRRLETRCSARKDSWNRSRAGHSGRQLESMGGADVEGA